MRCKKGMPLSVFLFTSLYLHNVHRKNKNKANK